MNGVLSFHPFVRLQCGSLLVPLTAFVYRSGGCFAATVTSGGSFIVFSALNKLHAHILRTQNTAINDMTKGLILMMSGAKSKRSRLPLRFQSESARVASRRPGGQFGENYG